MYVFCTAPVLGGAMSVGEERPGTVHDVKLSEAANNPHLSTNIISARVQLVGMAKTKKTPQTKDQKKPTSYRFVIKSLNFTFSIIVVQHSYKKKR